MISFVCILAATFISVLTVALTLFECTNRQAKHREDDSQVEKDFPTEERREMRLEYLRKRLRRLTVTLEQAHLGDAPDESTETTESVDEERDIEEGVEHCIRVEIPQPDVQGTAASEHRIVPNSCTICLSEFKVADKITWSSNKACIHVFHHRCVIDWLQTIGEKEFQYDPSLDKSTQISNFSMACPCCRQDFIVKEIDC